MTTIAYDQSIEDLIAGLDDTGHITHSKWKKTSVTFHHNGGRLSHQGVLNVWKTRPASAHFDVDAYGAVAQYAEVHTYAWATGNTRGNQTSISIEMCNKTLAPDWEVSETTWKAAARLAGWLFVHVIGEAPTRDNVLFHHDWLATACAGPSMDKVYSDLLAEVQSAYNAFKGGSTPVSPKAPSGSAEWTMGPKVAKALQDRAKSPGRHDGYFDSQDVANKKYYPNVTCMRYVASRSARGSVGMRAVQRMIGVHADGFGGPRTNKVLQRWAGMPASEQDGWIGTKSVEAICKKLGISG